jgi:hypothetical protein
MYCSGCQIVHVRGRGSGKKNVIFQMVPKSFLSVLIHSTRGVNVIP